MKTCHHSYNHVVDVDIFLEEGAIMPEYAHKGDSGMDLAASEDACVRPGETKLVPTGVYVALPQGYEFQVRPRSGTSFKTKLRVANTPGTIDSNYRGELKVIVDNLGEEEIKFNKGDRIAQIVLQKVPVVAWHAVKSQDKLGSTVRGEGGFGSTGQ